LNPGVVRFVNVTVAPTQYLGFTGVKSATGPEYTRMGEMDVNDESHALIALILMVNPFPGNPQEKVVYVWHMVFGGGCG
jgi:hypothetical protein